MKSASGGLIALLNNGIEFLIADLLTITTLGGSVYRYTDADINITLSGNIYTSHDMRFKHGAIRTPIGMEVATMDLVVWADATNLIAGVAFLQALQQGALDGANLTIDRLFMPTWGDTSLGTVNVFAGKISDSTIGRSEAKITVKSYLELLNIKLPRNLFQSGCIHTLYDAGCTLLKSNFQSSSIVSSGSTRFLVNCSLAQATGYFDQGELTFISGVNNGITRTIKSYVLGSPSVITLSYPLPIAPANGNTFYIWPGCDKQQATCSGKFSNLPNFGGFPYVPVPETAI